MAGCLCTAADLSRYVVGKCALDEEPVSNLQLQKILYFLQLVYCRTTGGKLLFNDQFEAWPYGPVIRSVYVDFSVYGGDAIEGYHGFEIPGIPDGVKLFIDAGIKKLRALSPWDLVRTSHAPGSPWAQVYRDGAGYKHTIPNSLIVDAAMKGE